MDMFTELFMNREVANMAAKKKIAQTVITEGKYYTINAANGKVVEVADYNIENGAKIQLWDDANAEWQQWGFVAAGDGVYRVQNRFTGKMMDLDMLSTALRCRSGPTSTARTSTGPSTRSPASPRPA